MKTVLIVDDEKDIRILLKKILSFKGYKTIEASNADEAIEMVNKENPDVILMDYNMPGQRNGLDAVSIIRNNHFDCTSKIIVMSASAADGLESKAFKLGANAFFRKPFRTSVLLNKIDLLAA
jgi:CheY-like chemotaxis protein